MRKKPQQHKASELLSMMNNGAIASAFARMGIAEQELQRADISPALDRAVFMALCPSKLFNSSHHPELYRHHVRELIERARKGESLQHGTIAECILALSATSMRAPLNAWADALVHHLFAQVFPKEAREIWKGDKPKEPHAGYFDQEIGELRRKLTDEKRTLRDAEGKPK